MSSTYGLQACKSEPLVTSRGKLGENGSSFKNRSVSRHVIDGFTCFNLEHGSAEFDNGRFVSHES